MDPRCVQVTLGQRPRVWRPDASVASVTSQRSPNVTAFDRVVQLARGSPCERRARAVLVTSSASRRPCLPREAPGPPTWRRLQHLQPHARPSSSLHPRRVSLRCAAESLLPSLLPASAELWSVAAYVLLVIGGLLMGCSGHYPEVPTQTCTCASARRCPDANLYLCISACATRRGARVRALAARS
jgi:hypothetical protein